MTRAIKEQDCEDAKSMPPGSPSSTAALNSLMQVSTDSASDNDESEKPVREKLKKTSIASIPRNDLVHSRVNTQSELDGTVVQPEDTRAPKEPSVPTNDADDSVNGSRGRSFKKRSFDDLEKAEIERDEFQRPLNGNLDSQMRKRSRDVPRTEYSTADKQSGVHSKTPVQEDDEPDVPVVGMNQPENEHLQGTSFSNAALTSDLGSNDLEMEDTILSPRKKRSREPLDSDTDREQKIVATEEAKAQRRSEENERDDLIPNRGSDNNQENNFPSKSQDESNKSPAGASNDFFTPLNENQMGLETPTILSRFATTTHTHPSPSLPRSPRNSLDQETQASRDPFMASGFAALAGSSTSPFGTLGLASKTAQTTSFGFKSTHPNPEIPHKSKLQTKSTDHPEDIKDGGAPSNGSPTSETSGPSAFSLPEGTKLHSFGNSTFGSGFGTAFKGGIKLSSFAAPVGDAKWGDENGETIPFAAPSKDEGDERSESEDDAIEDFTRDEEIGDADSRFQQQDVGTGEDGEQSIFSSPRANLYSWNGSAWKEGGRGTFKLNVSLPMSEGKTKVQKSGRFIMRAHQTFRVMLNTPVFKQMKIGDSKGNEPIGKSLSFSVIENGKPTPYLLKMNDEGESKTLYHEVRKLQQAL